MPAHLVTSPDPLYFHGESVVADCGKVVERAELVEAWDDAPMRGLAKEAAEVAVKNLCGKCLEKRTFSYVIVTAPEKHASEERQ